MHHFLLLHKHLLNQMDQILFITGDRVSRVSSFCSNVGGQSVEIEDAETVSLQFKSGMVGTFHGGYFLEGGMMEAGVTLWGSRGWLRINAHRRPDGSDESFQWYSTHEQAPRGVQTESPRSESGGYEGFVQAAAAIRSKLDASVVEAGPIITMGDE